MLATARLFEQLRGPEEELPSGHRSQYLIVDVFEIDATSRGRRIDYNGIRYINYHHG